MNKLGLAGRRAMDASLSLRSHVHAGAVAAIIAVVLVAGGCQTSTSPADRTGGTSKPVVKLNLPIEPADARRLGYSPQWPKKLGLGRGETVQHAVFADDLILTVERPHNLLTATSYRDGATLWSKAIGTELEQFSAPFRVGERILMNSARRLFQLRPGDGHLLYVTNLDYPVIHQPAVLGELAIYGGSNGRVFAHDLVSGFAKWEYQLPAEIRVAPVLNEVGVFAVDSSGVFAMLDGSDGQLLWKGRTFATVSGQPVAADAIYLASQDQTLYALDRATGEDLWKFRETAPLRQGPVVFDQYVLLPLGERGLVAIGAAKGDEIWRIAEPAQPVTLQGDRLLLNMGQALRLVEIATGETIEQVPTKPLKTVLVDPQTGSVILVTVAGELQRLDLSR